MSEADGIRDYFRRAAWRPSAGRTYLVEERFEVLRSLASAHESSFAELAVCDVGCGHGADLARWSRAGVLATNLAGTEVVPERAAAAAKVAAGADIRVVDGFALPFASAAFDLCTASLVLSTVRSADARKQLLAEMNRVTRPGGLVIVYDFAIRKPWNPHVGAITTRQLSRLWRRPDAIQRVAPFLPALDLALRMPRLIRGVFIRALPRTHRVWSWKVNGPSEVPSD